MSTLPLFGPRPKRTGSGSGQGGTTLRVSQLNRAVRMLLEDRFAGVWVTGELSDVTHAGSGHIYFTLNDEDEAAQLRGVMFRSDARRAKARMQNGERVKLRGNVSLFEPRGNYQLIARVALPDGEGDLHAQFEAVRQRLDADGLLDPERKRPLPQLPRTIGVVTSDRGAALHDIIRVAEGRCPVRIVVSPCLVQGPDAPRSIVAALDAIERLPGLDVIIIGRGGGAAEDLVAFNDERVARRIAALRVPSVSAVGHEVDISIADLVADVRASTPSHAAELCVPDRAALEAELLSAQRSLQHAMELRMSRARVRLGRLEAELSDPRSVLASVRGQLSALEHRLRAATTQQLQARRRELSGIGSRLSRRDPRQQLARDRARLQQLDANLRRAGGSLCHEPRKQLSTMAAQLSALSPLSVLARGYAIALHGPDGKALLQARDAQDGDTIELRLHDGTLRTRVES